MYYLPENDSEGYGFIHLAISKKRLSLFHLCWQGHLPGQMKFLVIADLNIFTNPR
jgi:hypothetical protein